MNVIGTQLREPITSGLIRWRLTVHVYVGFVVENGNQSRECASTRFRLSVDDERADAERNGQTVSRDQILGRERKQGNIHFPCLADDEQDWQPYPVDPYSNAEST